MAQRIPCLFVAEKPSIARTLAEVLSNGRSRHRSSPSPTNPCYDFELDIEGVVDSSLPNAGRRMNVTVTSVRGHLMSMDFESKATRNWRRTAHREMFDAVIERSVSAGLEEVAKNVQKEATRCKVLVIWTDCDREGEAIGEEILLQAASANDRILCKRARFSAANAPDLWRAVNSLRDLNRLEVNAVLARQEIDLRLGAVFTRFQTIALQDKVDALEGKVVSFGPCQFPTLGFIVARYEAILAFEKETFWQIRMAHTASAASNDNREDAMEQQQLFHFTWSRNRLFDQALSLVAYDMCVRHPEATVVEVTRKPTSRWRPIPLSTVELQVRAANWLKLDSETTMRAAESLYQRGIISYPRTETEMFSDTFDLRAIVNEFRPSPQYGQFVSKLLDEDGFQPPRKGAKNDEAHPPIHPTKFVTDLKEIPEIRVYELVCRHFLACCAKDAIGSESVLRVKIAAETFSAKGLVVHERNFLEMYIYEKWGDRSIPDLREGDKFVPTKLELVPGETSPPDLLTEADLIRLMDKNGIGTDATIQDHIKTVLEREYATKLPEKQNRFAPSNLGVALVRAYNTMGHELAISRPELRSEMERDLVRICRGEKSKEEVVRTTVDKYREVFLDVLRKKDVLLQYVESVFFTGEEDVSQGFDEVLTPGLCKCGVCGAMSMELVRRQTGETGRLGLRCANALCAKFRSVLHPLPTSQQFVTRPDAFCCPICHYQVLSTVGDRPWFFCPNCFVHPPVSADLEDLSSMPCYKCTKKECQLSGNVPEDPIMACPECQSNVLVLKKRSTPDATSNGFYLRCKTFPVCKGSSRLPRCCKDVSTTNETCSGCGARKLAFKFDREKVPLGSQLNLVECPNYLTCDKHSRDFREVLEMENLRSIPQSSSLSNERPVPTNPSSRTTSQPTSVAPTMNQNQGFTTSVSHSQHRVVNQGPVSQIGNQDALQYQGPVRQAPVFSQQLRQGSMPQPRPQGAVQISSSFQRASSMPPPPQDITRFSRPCRTCGQMLSERKSTTSTNPGRAFFKCEPCNVFEWADQPAGTAASSSSSVASTFHQGSSARGQNQNGYGWSASNQQPTAQGWPSSSVGPRGGNQGQAAWSSGASARGLSSGSRGPVWNGPLSSNHHQGPSSGPRGGLSSIGRGPAMNCYHCGSTDHFPVQCPSQHPSSSSSSSHSNKSNDVCFKCGQSGHWSSQCGNGNSQAGAPRGAPANKQFRGKSSNFNRKGVGSRPKQPRHCTVCSMVLPPRKRICEGCGERYDGLPTKKSSNEPYEDDILDGEHDSEFV